MLDNTVIKDIENLRARFAYQQVEKAIAELDDQVVNYKSYIKKMPMLIKNNGLGNALAYVFSNCKKQEGKKDDKKRAYSLIYEQIAKWLREQKWISEEQDLIYQIVNLDSPRYKAITLEVLALLTWMGRFSEGLIEKRGDN